MCDCGKLYEFSYVEDHNTYQTEQINLNEYGACNGYIYLSECKCGEFRSYSIDIWCCDQQTDNFYVDEDGIYHYINVRSCSACGLVYTQEYYDVQEACYEYRYFIVTVEIGGNTILNASYRNLISTSHNYLMSDYVLNGESCEDGVTVTMTCPDCGDSYEEYITSHVNYNIEYYDFTDYGACHGYYSIYRCPCGESNGANVGHCAYSNTSTESYVDENGVSHTITVYTCPSCGLVRTRDRYNQEDSCYTYRINTYTFSMNGEYICSYSERSTISTHHNYVYTHVFADENNRNCEAGVTTYYVCVDCGYSGSNYYTDHNRYRVYTADMEALGCCGNHTFLYDACPCGESYYYDCYGGTYYNSSTMNYECHNSCGYVVKTSEDVVADGCLYYYVTTISMYVNEVEIYSFNYTTTRVIHDFATLVMYENDGYSVYMTCQNCGENVSTSSGSVMSETVTLENHDGTYYYDYEFTPAESGAYVIKSSTSGDTYVTLYRVDNGQYVQLNSNDDSGGNGNFKLAYSLVAGETYIYRIRFYNSSNAGDISFTLGKTFELEGDPACESHNISTIKVVPHNADSCDDGIFHISMCNCGRINDISISTSHDIEYKERIDYCSEGGYVEVYSCLCGNQSYINRSNCSHGTYSNNNEYVDEDGIRWYVYSCYTDSNCPSNMRYDQKYYYVYNTENCTRTTYYTETLSVGDALAVITHRDITEQWHDYETTYELQGTTCNQGVNIKYQCVNCEYYETTTVYHHSMFEIERFDNQTCGAECTGYISILSCACGYNRSVDIGDSDCSFYHMGTTGWIENALNNSQETAQGTNSFYSNFYSYTCAVTDPEQCGFVVRYGTYWIATGNCTATQYFTVQIGYNEADDTCVEERTYTLGSYTYHNYEYSDISSEYSNGYTYTCSDCGSYFSNINYYNDNGHHIKSETKYVNTLDDGHIKYREYSYEYLGGTFSSYLGNVTTSYYYKTISADGIEYWQREVYTYEEISAPFGENSYSRNTRYTCSEGNETVNEYAETLYKGYTFTLYSYHEDIISGYWYRYEYNYSFDNGCEVIEVFTNSYGEQRTSDPRSAHPTHNYKTIQDPTCTQYGIRGYWCPVCEHSWGEYKITPKDHNWVFVMEDLYYCHDCGLQNINGASGDMVMEDLTEKFGNGEAYVIGYWNRQNIQFTPYVIIYLHEPMIVDGFEEYAFLLWMMDENQFHFVEDEYVGLYVNISDINDAVAMLCDMYGIVLTPDMYDVSISFVPDGADDNFDYAITFADLSGSEDIDNVIRHDEFIIQYVGEGENIDFTVVSDETAVWEFESFANQDTYVYIFDENGAEITRDDDGGRNNNFFLSYTLEEGKTYTIRVRWYSSNRSGYMPISFKKV